MIRYKEWVIDTSGEYPLVCKTRIVKEGKTKGEEVITPVYFPRDILGALKILQRVTTTSSTGACKDLKEVIKAIEKNQEELIKLVEGALDG